jgi:hypothetical protein
MVPADGQGEKHIGACHELSQRLPIGELEDSYKSRKKEGDRTERSREEDDEIEEGDHLQEDQREGTRELHGPDYRE